MLPIHYAPAGWVTSGALGAAQKSSREVSTAELVAPRPANRCSPTPTRARSDSLRALSCASAPERRQRIPSSRWNALALEDYPAHPSHTRAPTHSSYHHSSLCSWQVMLLHNTSGMPLNKKRNSKSLAESETGLVTRTSQLKAVRAQGATKAQPQHPKLHSSPHRALLPFGVCPAAQFDRRMLPHSSSLTYLSQTTSWSWDPFCQGRNIPGHAEPAWQGILNVSSSLQRAWEISDSTHSFWSFFFPS